jgi:alkylation response protein AidB-like acyl-CoA dehydrogenase
MSLVLRDEERLLKDAAHAFFPARAPVKALRALRDTRDGTGFERALWRDMADLGWAGILVPEAHGGSAFGYRGMGVVLEEAGRSLCASPLVGTAVLGAPLIAELGSPAQQAAILPAVAAGECVLALALEETPWHAPHQIATCAERVAGGYRLRGRKTFVLDAHVADHLLVVARTHATSDAADELAVFLLAAETPGLVVTRTPMVDSRNAGEVVFNDVKLADAALLGTAGAAWPALERCLDGARAGLAAFERTLAYLKLRHQFGVPIGSFQALKHRAALMYCELELARSCVIAALHALDEARADSALLVSLAKAKACDTLELVTNEAVQLHGGIGMTDLDEIGLFLKRARVQQMTFGDARFHRARYAHLCGL